MTEKRWNILQTDETKAKQLNDQLQLGRAASALLARRGIVDSLSYHQFIQPSLTNLHDPWLMKDMDQAVDRILEAISKKEKILVFGDYDVDGTTAVAVFYQFLLQLHPQSHTDFYIPHRFREGYGISQAGIDYAYANKYTLIVALDCGIKSVDLINYAKTLGIDFIICDHHLPGPVLPAACAILNPKQAECTYPYKDLCGCGIGYKFITAIAQKIGMPESSYLCYLDLVATAIAADIVPMTGENRILAFHGLKQINQSPSLGIKTIIELSAIRKELNISNVVFMIAPRVNAAGRMDDARKAVLLFIEKDPVKAKELGEALQSDNVDRKLADKNITAEAIGMIEKDPVLIQKKSCVLYNPEWNKGVVGIVASRVIEQYYRPTIILTKSEGLITGSARSIKDFNLYEAIYSCKEHLLTFGGHFAAAGLTMKEENLPAFTEQFESAVTSIVTDEMLIPEISLDMQVQFSELNYSLYTLINMLEPFGPENMKPVFVARKVKDRGYSKLLKEQHVKFDLIQNQSLFSGIGFNMPEKYALVKSGKNFDIVFTLDENDYNGQRSLQLQIIDCRESKTDDSN